jgi:hypothetical protein
MYENFYRIFCSSLNAFINDKGKSVVELQKVCPISEQLNLSP